MKISIKKMESNAIHQGKAAQIWRAGGMIWLISVTFFFALLDLCFDKLPAIFTIIIGILIFSLSVFLFAWSIKTLRIAKKLPDEKSGIGTLGGYNMRKWFLIILILEIAGLNIATFTLLKLNLFQYIVPVDILIVALHLYRSDAFFLFRFITSWAP